MKILILLILQIKKKGKVSHLKKKNKKNKGQNEILKIWRTLNYLIFLQDYLFWTPVTVKLKTKLCPMLYGNNISFVLRKIVTSLCR